MTKPFCCFGITGDKLSEFLNYLTFHSILKQKCITVSYVARESDHRDEDKKYRHTLKSSCVTGNKDEEKLYCNGIFMI